MFAPPGTSLRLPIWKHRLVMLLLVPSVQVTWIAVGNVMQALSWPWISSSKLILGSVGISARLECKRRTGARAPVSDRGNALLLLAIASSLSVGTELGDSH